MEAAKRMPKTMWSHAVLDASDKGNYLTTAQMGKLQASPNMNYDNIAQLFPGAKIPCPSVFIP